MNDSLIEELTHPLKIDANKEALLTYYTRHPLKDCRAREIFEKTGIRDAIIESVAATWQEMTNKNMGETTMQDSAIQTATNIFNIFGGVNVSVIAKPEDRALFASSLARVLDSGAGDETAIGNMGKPEKYIEGVSAALRNLGFNRPFNRGSENYPKYQITEQSR